MSRNKKAPSVDTPKDNSIISFVYERGTIDLDTAVLVQHRKPRLAVKTQPSPKPPPIFTYLKETVLSFRIHKTERS